MAYFNGREILLVGLKGPRGYRGDSPYIGPNGNWFVGDTDTGVVADASSFDARIEAVERDLADLLYRPISASFTNNVGIAEIGSTVDTVKLTWTLNKTPKSVTIDGEAQTASAEGSVTLTDLGLKEYKAWTLKATDERDAVATKTTTVSFLNGVYYGVAAEPETIDSTFILSSVQSGLMKRTLRGSKITSFNANVTTGKYLWYCLPVEYGTCTFSLGVLPGGVGLVDTILFENASGHKENYYVYRSDYAGIGSKSVTVK